MFDNDKTNPLHEMKPHELALRGKLVDEILAISPHSSADFLRRFTSEQLRSYLAHLQHSQEPRGTRWKRRSTSPAVVQYRPSA